VIFRLVVPKTLTQEQEILFEQLKRSEGSVNQEDAQKMYDSQVRSNTGEAKDGESVFDKFKNMWSNI